MSMILTASYAHSSRILVRSLTAHDTVMSVSLKATWALTQHKRPFTAADVSKKVMVTVLEKRAIDKSMDSIISSVK